MSWFQFYVSLSELLLWMQEGAVPATSGAVPAAAAAPADAAGGAAGPALAEPNPIVQFAPYLIFVLFFYFILFLPTQKERRRRQDFLKSLKKNSRVVTTGGLIGTVVDLSSDERFVTLRVDDTTRVRFLRSAIHGELEEKIDSAGASGAT